MKVLITGTHGQLVSSLLERGRGRAGIHLIPLGRPQLDLEIPGSAAAALRDTAPDVVINAAAFTAVDQAEDEPDRAMRINGDAAGELAVAARETGARIIQISTDYVFDGASPRPYGEDVPVNPLGAYGRSKLAGEEAVRAATPDHLILRTAWVYSPFGANFLKTMLRLAESRDEVGVVSDQRGNPSSALDLADGILEILGDWRRGGGTGLGRTYHLAGTGAASWFDFASVIFGYAAEFGLASARVTPILTSDWPTKAVRPANSMLDCARFHADFGFQTPEWQVSAKAVIGRLAGRTDVDRETFTRPLSMR